MRLLTIPFQVLIALVRFVPIGTLKQGFWNWVAMHVAPHIDASIYIEEQLGWLTKAHIDQRIRELLHRSEIRSYHSSFIAPTLNYEHVLAEIMGVGYFSMKVDISGLSGGRLLLKIYGRAMSLESDSLVWRLSNSYPIERKANSLPELVDIPEEYYHNGVRAVLVQTQGDAKPLYYEWFWR